MKPYIPARRGPRGGLVVAPAEKASLLGSQFDCKQCREQFVTPLSCFPQSRSNSWAFRTSVLLCLLLDLDTYAGCWSFGCVSSFLKMVADIISPKLNIIFCRLIHQGSLPECCLSTNVTAIPHATKMPHAAKISEANGIISLIRNTLDSKSKNHIYYSLIHPYLTYCVNVWYPTYQTNLKTLCTPEQRSVHTLIATAQRPPFGRYLHQWKKFSSG